MVRFIMWQRNKRRVGIASFETLSTGGGPDNEYGHGYDWHACVCVCACLICMQCMLPDLICFTRLLYAKVNSYAHLKGGEGD